MAYGAILGQRGIQSVNGVPSGVNGNVDLSAGNMTSGIDMNSQTLTGLTTPVNDTDAVTKQYTDEAVQNATPYNWLDNSDFTNLVAQAGIGGNHGSQAYAADRWILTSGSVSQQDGGLQLNGTITQKLEHPPTGMVSAFVGMASGQASISYSSGTVTITSSGGVIAWAALYAGTYTEQTKPEYHPKGYAVEFTECHKYYRTYQSNGDNMSLTGYITGGSLDVRVLPPEASPMRIANPTIQFSGKLILRGPDGYATNANFNSPYQDPNIAIYNTSNTYLPSLTIKTQDSSAWGLTNNVVISAQILGPYNLEFIADL